MSSWKSKAASKRAENLTKIPQPWVLEQHMLDSAGQSGVVSGGYIESLLDDTTRTITNSSNASLLQLMGKGTLSALDVVTAFCKRAAYGHQLNNNLLEIAFAAAQQKARVLDQYFKQNGRLIGPLHGLPYSMKDQWHIKGLDTSMAYVGWIGTQGGRPRTPDQDDVQSELVTELSTLGAILIAKTSMMQTTWDGETDNNILGYLWNPNVKGLSAGGSSGGEGALQSLRGSAFGFGTDSGGSVSMPAAANGVYSLKPSSGRISMKDTVTSSEGQMLIPTVAGIFAPSVSDIRLVFQALLATKPWLRDPDIVPLPYRLEAAFDDDQLAFGMLVSDGVVMPHPPIARALRIVSKALAVQGHQIMRWVPPSHSSASELHSAIVHADGVADIFDRTALSGEPFMPSLRVDEANHVPKSVPLGEYYAAAQRLQSWRAEYAAYWNSTEQLINTGRPVDAIILPVSPHAAPRPGEPKYYGYSCVINVLDYCSVVVPVSKADKNIDVVNPDYQPVGSIDMNTWKAYDPEIYHGAPTAVQIVCRRLEEEKLLSIAQVVVEALEACQST